MSFLANISGWLSRGEVASQVGASGDVMPPKTQSEEHSSVDSGITGTKSATDLTKPDNDNTVNHVTFMTKEDDYDQNNQTMGFGSQDDGDMPTTKCQPQIPTMGRYPILYNTT